ncbi:MAG: hypothetical protein OEL56_02440 [Nitrosopumilus sp.]|nr:hypothetical protein [Nitrosopumilus sp.]MDH3489287.1 hypothetical protein [Nitrosopumilus sp.]MDH3516285.1 hypothetical protein [Nitrosopumilus sp.]MDH3564050.1 hypothetical protein [Nitrosopumilus sp.]MDH5417212.1 hypothetical protein [Nitrosopumilus sp.]
MPTDETINQAPVKIDKILKEKIQEWVKTEQAHNLGFYSLAEFVTKASMEAFEKYAKTNDNPKRFFMPNNENHLLDLDLDFYLESGKVVCVTCESEDCIHIKTIQTDRVVKKHISKFLKSVKKKRKDQ